MTTMAEAARVKLRSEFQLRLVESAEEGTAAPETPRGVYGFTGSPGLAAPLFRERRYRNFEIHHQRDGTIAIVGFVTPAERTRLERTNEPIDVTLYPDAEGEATELAAIAYARVAHHRQYSILNQPGMRLRVSPQFEQV